VVIRGQRATFFTRNDRRSRKPVHLVLRGVAIRLPGDASECGSSLVDPLELERRSRNGEPLDVESRDA
jgi:hypothetical protein